MACFGTSVVESGTSHRWRPASLTARVPAGRMRYRLGVSPTTRTGVLVTPSQPSSQSHAATASFSPVSRVEALDDIGLVPRIGMVDRHRVATALRPARREIPPGIVGIHGPMMSALATPQPAAVREHVSRD